MKDIIFHLVNELIRREIEHNEILESYREEKKIDEKAKEEFRRQLKATAKMAALGEMSGGVAHEINNPLGIISAQTQMLMSQIKDVPAEKRKALTDGLNNINRTIERIAKIVKSLRAFSSGASRETLEVVSVEEIVKDTLTFCGPKIKSEGVRLDLELRSDLSFECRPAQISQVLVNLIINSVDAVGQLSDKWIKVTSLGDENVIEIKITDSGGGISPGDRDQLMHPFFTTKPAGKGLGLGLSISLGIIQAHRGILYFDHDQANTTVVIRLPVKQSGSLNQDQDPDHGAFRKSS